MFWIYEVLSGKESRPENDYNSRSFDLEWNHLENWYFDNHILR